MLQEKVECQGLHVRDNSVSESWRLASSQGTRQSLCQSCCCAQQHVNNLVTSVDVQDLLLSH